jgi:hypothetical protein
VGNPSVVSVEQLLGGAEFEREGVFELAQFPGPVVASLNLSEMAAHASTDPTAASETETARAVLGFLSMASEAAVLGKVCSPRAAHPEQFRDKTDQLPRGTRVQQPAIEKEQILDSLLDGSGQGGLDLFEFCSGRDFSRPARAPCEHNRFRFR